jgi:hypothetical protein
VHGQSSHHDFFVHNFVFKGFVTAWSEPAPGEILRLIKHMPEKETLAWERESALASLLTSSNENPNLLNYCWHANGKARINILL